MVDQNLEDQMKELLYKDRLRYIEMIMNSDKGLGSREISRMIIKEDGKTGKEALKRENSKVNKRLRKLIDLGILTQNQEKKYTLSTLGSLVVDTWRELTAKIETINKFQGFFDSHYIDDLPKEFSRQIYKLKEAEITLNSVQWLQELEKQTAKTERKLYSLTEYLHHIPDDIIERKKSGEIKEIVVIYQFNEYPVLNSPNETELFHKLVEAGAEFRFLTLNERHAVGIRIVDEKWATFGLTKTVDDTLERENAFYGTDFDFVSWCRDLMYHIWSFQAKPLQTEEVKARKEVQ